MVLLIPYFLSMRILDQGNEIWLYTCIKISSFFSLPSSFPVSFSLLLLFPPLSIISRSLLHVLSYMLSEVVSNWSQVAKQGMGIGKIAKFILRVWLLLCQLFLDRAKKMFQNNAFVLGLRSLHELIIRGKLPLEQGAVGQSPTLSTYPQTVPS